MKKEKQGKSKREQESNSSYGCLTSLVFLSSVIIRQNTACFYRPLDQMIVNPLFHNEIISQTGNEELSDTLSESSLLIDNFLFNLFSGLENEINEID